MRRVRIVRIYLQGEYLWHLGEKSLVLWAVPRFIESKSTVKFPAFRIRVQIRQESDAPAQQRLAILAADRGARKSIVLIVIFLHGLGALPEMNFAVDSD